MPRPAMVWGATLVMSSPWNEQAAAGRLVDAADEVEDGALARAVGADDGEDLALRHIEGDAVDGLDAAERDGDVVGLEQGRRRALWLAPRRDGRRSSAAVAGLGVQGHRTRSVLR